MDIKGKREFFKKNQGTFFFLQFSFSDQIDCHLKNKLMSPMTGVLLFFLHSFPFLPIPLCQTPKKPILQVFYLFFLKVELYLILSLITATGSTCNRNTYRASSSHSTKV
jgi:hypothetical protein